MTTIKIPTKIVAKGRPRFTKRGHAYTPKKTKDFEKIVKLYAMQVAKEPLSEPLEVDILVQKKPPKSWSKKKRKQAIEGDIQPSVKPDIDNYGKSIIDGLNGVAFDDDNQICELSLKKVYAEEDGAIIKIKELIK